MVVAQSVWSFQNAIGLTLFILHNRFSWADTFQQIQSLVCFFFLGKSQHLWYIFGFLLNIFPQKIVLNILIESKFKKEK